MMIQWNWAEFAGSTPARREERRTLAKLRIAPNLPKKPILRPAPCRF
jgi:hypothetical protein